MAKFRNSKNKIFTSFAFAIAILILAIAILINIIVAKLDFNIDVSVQKMFTLSSISSKYLDELDEKGTTVDIYLLCELSDIESDSSSLSLYRALHDYDAHECINLIDFNPNTNEEMMKKINPDNNYVLSTGDMIFVCGENKRHVTGTSMYTTYQSMDNNGVVTESDQYFRGENIITSAIKAVVDGYVPTVYFLTGHGEKGMDSDYSNLKSLLLSKNYQAKTLNLSDVESVPDDTAFLLMPAPTSDITKQELQKLNDYLDLGGNLSLMFDPNGGTFDYDNLEALLSNFCINIDYDYVKETDSNCHVAGDDTTILCNLVSQDEDSKLYADVESLIDADLYTYMPKSRSFVVNIADSRIQTIESGTLISTNTSAVGVPFGGTYDTKQLENVELALAVYAEDKGRNNAKVAVFGNAEFIDDANIQDVSFLSSYYVYLSTVSWMFEQNLDMGIESKTSTEDYLSLDESTAYTLITIYLLIPVVILVIGVGIWMKRRHS